MDHVVVVLFENRSLDNVLGHLIPERAEHGAKHKVVFYTVATDMGAGQL